jgi:hypothetical protein
MSKPRDEMNSDDVHAGNVPMRNAGRPDGAAGPDEQGLSNRPGDEEDEDEFDDDDDEETDEEAEEPDAE